jgi:6-phosphogluconolactonase (cycloisomerase 2 family)
MSARTSLPALSLLSNRVNVLLALLFSFLVLGATRADAQGPGNRTGAFVYTGNDDYPGTSNNLVNGYAINPTGGTLTTVAGSPFAAGGQVISIAAHPSGRFAYAATGNGNNTAVAAFTVDSLDGALTPVPGSPYAVSLPALGWGTLLAIDPAGKFLYVAGALNLYGFAIDATTGELSALAGSPFSASAFSVAIDPSGKYLVAWNGGARSSTYGINGTTGALTQSGSLGSGCGGSSMVFEPSGHFLYGTGYDGGIAACSFDSGSGTLAAVTGSPLASPAAGYFSGVAVHPSGAFLYASLNNCVDSGPGNYLYGFLIDPSSGNLTAIGGSPFALPVGGGCYYDYGVATEASGNFVYTVDANYGTAAYTVNQTTGALTLASSTFSAPGAETVTTAPNAMSPTATVTGLAIVPSSAQIHTSTLGAQYQFTLAATFSDGSTGFLTGSATWTSSNRSVATVAAGLATSTGYGTTTITASVGGQSATASLIVAEPALTSITVAPSTVTVYQGTAIQLTATGEYTDGSSVDVTSTVTWSSSNTSIATISAQGLVQSIGLGTDTVSATLQNVTGTNSVTVVPPFVWQTPAPITYGTVLGSAQLDATSGVSGTFTYSPPAGTLLPAGSQSLNVAFTPDTSAIASIHGPAANSKGGGPRTAVFVTPYDSGNSLAVAATVTLVVNQATQSIAFTAPTSPAYYPASPITLIATGGASGNPVTFSIVSGPGSLSGTNNSQLTVAGGGTIVIAANQAGNTNYSAATQVTQSIVVDQLATLTSPAPGSTLTGSSATFTWTAVAGVTQYVLGIGSTGVGSYNLYNSTPITATQANVTGLPTNGETLYARLYSWINGAWQYHDYTYKAAATPVTAVLTSPAPGSKLTGSGATFQWTTGTAVTQYVLGIGSTGVGSYNLFNSTPIAATQASVTGLPTNGTTLYARLYSMINGAWQYNDYTYTAAATPAVLTSPTPGSTLTSSSATFQWTAGTGVTQYVLGIGSTGVGSYNLFNSTPITATQASVTGLPTNGTTLYARIYSLINGAWQYNDYIYTAAPTPVPAVLTSPTPGTALTSSSVTFQWTAGTGVTQYVLGIGSTGVGSYNLFNSTPITATQANVTGLPTNGETLYARLYSWINGAWQYHDYTYTGGAVPVPAVLTSPAPGSSLTGSGATFQWTTGTAVTQYVLGIGSTGVGSYNLFNSTPITATQASVTGLPTNGTTLYARLYSWINGAWQYHDYTYTAAATPAVLTSPTPGTALTSSSATFQWTAGTGVTQYVLGIGSTGVGSYNLFNSTPITATQASVTGLPTNGETLYARIYSWINGAWQFNDYIYTAAATPVPAVLTSPTSGSTLTSSSATFQWTAGTGVTQYVLGIGSTGVGSSNLFNSTPITATQASVTGLPTNGETLYARLYSWINGAWQYHDYTYTAAATPAVLTSPTPGTALTSSSVTFQWTAGTGVTQYVLGIGSTGVGSYNLYNSTPITATQASVTGLPTNGETLYARLYSLINGAWQYHDYTYTAQ